jgi:hypothetical protein
MVEGKTHGSMSVQSRKGFCRRDITGRSKEKKSQPRPCFPWRIGGSARACVRVWQRAWSIGFVNDVYCESLPRFTKVFLIKFSSTKWYRSPEEQHQCDISRRLVLVAALGLVWHYAYSRRYKSHTGSIMLVSGCLSAHQRSVSEWGADLIRWDRSVPALGVGSTVGLRSFVEKNTSMTMLSGGVGDWRRLLCVCVCVLPLPSFLLHTRTHAHTQKDNVRRRA